MSLELAADIWEELKSYVNVVDRADAADNMVSIMIDHDYEAEDILSAFAYDSEVKRALASYLTQDNYEEEDEHEDDFDDED